MKALLINGGMGGCSWRKWVIAISFLILNPNKNNLLQYNLWSSKLKFTYLQGVFLSCIIILSLWHN